MINKELAKLDYEKYKANSSRAKMSTIDRAGQFNPYSALVGFHDQIKEKARLVDRRIILSDDELALLNEKVSLLKEQLVNLPEVELTYFIPDENKEGGKYVSEVFNIKGIDEYRREYVSTTNYRIRFEDVIEIKFI